MLAATFSSQVDSQLAALKATLLEECDKIAKEREQNLKAENEQLRKEISVLQQRQGYDDVKAGTAAIPNARGDGSAGGDVDALVGEVVNALSTECSSMIDIKVDQTDEVPAALPAPIPTTPVTSPKHEPMSPNRTTSGSIKKPAGRLEPSPELTAVAKLGDMNIGDEFWQEGDGMRRSDSGFCSIGSVTSGSQPPKLPPPARTSHCWVISPTGELKLSWDIAGIPVLAWDLITIPMQVFGIEDSDIMVFMGWVTLIFWTIDVPFCFTTGYFDNEGELVMDFGKICLHYMRGMFSLDMLIIGADWVSITLEAVAGGNPPGFLANMALLRILRISRFARLMRLRKLKAKWQTVEDHIDMCHYVGCIWFFLGQQEIEGYQTWLQTPYFQYQYEKNPDNIILKAPWAYQYFTAVHFAITQFTPGGMHVQPQNIPERAFTIFCLLFGLVLFSAFIANVTQARMQLNKMMSKFERDLWLLRKFCRQNHVSRTLTIRMRRYVDLVLIPKFQTMNTKDVILLPQLSEHLREELQTELETQKLVMHPFFQELAKNKSAMMKICNHALLNQNIARGDVVFAPGLTAKFMYIVTDGTLDYVPHNKDIVDERLTRGRWICEAAMWTGWITQGQLQGETESTALGVDGSKFRQTLASNAMHMQYARHYCKGFLDRLNAAWDDHGLPTDLQEEFATASHGAAHVAKLSGLRASSFEPKGTHGDLVSPGEHAGNNSKNNQYKPQTPESEKATVSSSSDRAPRCDDTSYDMSGDGVAPVCAGQTQSPQKPFAGLTQGLVQAPMLPRESSDRSGKSVDLNAASYDGGKRKL